MQPTDVSAFWQTGKLTKQLAESGLLSVDELDPKSAISSDERALLEKAKAYGASHVFFRRRDGRARVAEALVFDDASPNCTRTDDDFAKLHRQLWSWGAVPLVYRRRPGCVDIFRCGHGPDFDAGREKPKYAVYNSLKTAGDITQQLEAEPWWDLRRLANGTLWDDKSIAEQFLSDASAHKTLLRNVEALDKQLADESGIAANLRRRLLIISLLIAYLEDREVFKLEANFFKKFKDGAEKFHDVLGDAKSLIKLLAYLETERFNGNVFTLQKDEKKQLLQTTHLHKFAELIQGNTEAGVGQRTLWRLYSFRDLPVELISHIYQFFVEDKTTCVYTPPFLARLMLEEALTLERMDRLEKRDELVFDPSCGSGVFLVEAFKRLVLHWRKNHNWQRPPVDVLRTLMKRVRGTDIDGSAVELAAFSLCLAMCEELEPPIIWRTGKLFPVLKGKTLVEACFFEQAREQKLPRNIGVAVGNPPFVSGSDKGTTTQAYQEYIDKFGEKSLPDIQAAYLFLHHSMEALVPDGLLCLLQKDNFLYNRRSAGFRHAIFERWEVREILDFTPIRNLFEKDAKVIVVLAEAHPPKPERPILHAIFRRTTHTQAELSFELDYYDMQWVPRHVALTKDFVWRCNLFGGGRTVSLVERLKKLPKLKAYVKQQGWDYGEGYMVGTPEKDEVIDYLYKQPVISTKAILADGTVDERLIEIQAVKKFQWPRPKTRYAPPLVLIPEIDELRLAYWENGTLTYDSRLVGISAASGNANAHSAFFKRLQTKKHFFRSWLTLTSSDAGIKQSTTLQKGDIDNLPFPENEADLDLSSNDEIILNDAFDFYRDYQRLGDDAAMMRPATPGNHQEFARIYTRQINTVHKKLRPLPTKSWAGICCQPFVFGMAEPDWKDTESLTDKLTALLRSKKSATLTTVRILRIFDGPFVFLIKPDRLRYWLRSIALRDADESLADLRRMGF